MRCLIKKKHLPVDYGGTEVTCVCAYLARAHEILRDTTSRPRVTKMYVRDNEIVGSIYYVMGTR
jgi:hypothetical protein